MTRRDVGVKVMRAIGLPESVVSAFQKGEVYVTDSSCGLMSVVESDSPFSDEIAKLESATFWSMAAGCTWTPTSMSSMSTCR